MKKVIFLMAVVCCISGCGKNDVTSKVTEPSESKVVESSVAITKEENEFDKLQNVNQDVLFDKTVIMNKCSIILGETNIDYALTQMGEPLKSTKENYYVWGTQAEGENYSEARPADVTKQRIEMFTLDSGIITSVAVHYGRDMEEDIYKLDLIPKDITSDKIEETFGLYVDKMAGGYKSDKNGVEVWIKMNTKEGKITTPYTVIKQLTKSEIEKLK